MSCTENESGPLVKYLLPVVFGGLTLVLAKRWASLQAPHISTAAVSKRRRFVKDPLLKRPLPCQSSKGMSHGKRETCTRKSSSAYSSLEEECVAMAGGSRRPSRGPRPSPPSPPPPSNLLTDSPRCGGTSPPRHVPFPSIPHDGELLFEVMMFLFTALAAGTQFLNLYRTVWWLPHSYTSQTMNFYLIDRHLVVFIVVVLGRRLLFSLCSSAVHAVTPNKLLPVVIKILRMIVLVLVLVCLGWCTYHLMQTHPILNIFYLCYPASVYLLLFGLNASPLLELTGGAGCSPRAPHCCEGSAPLVRTEVEVLKADFNQRLKQVIFSSVVGAYYSSYVPWCFAQSFLYYDVYRVIRHLALVWLGLFTQHAAHCLSARYCDHLHRAALHLGRWVKGGAVSSGPHVSVSWCHKTMWASGSVVRHSQHLYTAKGPSTAAEPDNHMHHRFHMLFHNPSTLVCVLLSMQLSLVLVQLLLLFNTTEWHHVLSLALLLFSNYYTLFKLVRDYLVTWKVYQAEVTIQDKASAASQAISS